jgi:hypothetical protein
LKKKTSSQLSVCIWEWRDWHLGISLSLSIAIRVTLS